MTDPILWTQLAGFGAFFWLWLYVLGRGRSSPLLRAILAGLFGQAAFFCSSALSYQSAGAERLALIERWSWWTAVLPAVAWWLSSTLLACQLAGLPAPRRRIGLALGAGLLISLAGAATPWFVRYGGPLRPGADGLTLPPGPLYPLYVALLLWLGGDALWRLLLARRAAPPALAPRIAGLAAGALLFWIGGLWIAARYAWNLSLPLLAGYGLLLAGMTALGYGMAQVGLVVQGQQVRRDVLYSLTGVLLANMLYISLLGLATELTAAALALLVGLVTLTHTGIDRLRQLLDRLFFSPPERAARAGARAYAAALATDPVAPWAAPAQAVAPAEPGDGPDAAEPEPGDADEPAVGEIVPSAPGAAPKPFRDQVRRAISGLKNPLALANSPLLSHGSVGARLAAAGLEDNRLNRAACLRELLIEHIEGLRPADDGAAPAGEARRFFNVLYYPYVAERSRKQALSESRRLAEQRRRAGAAPPGETEQVLAWLAEVDENTFFKWQRKASDVIAQVLWDAHPPQA